MIEENIERQRHRWTRRHPRAGAAFFAGAALAGVAFVARGFVALASGAEASLGLLGYMAFFGLGAVVNSTAVVRQLRIARDPSIDNARLQALLDQPREQLVRKARRALWVFAAVFVVAGVLLAVTSLPASSHLAGFGSGSLLVVLGVVMVLVGEKRMRDPDVYL